MHMQNEPAFGQKRRPGWPHMEGAPFHEGESKSFRSESGDNHSCGVAKVHIKCLSHCLRVMGGSQSTQKEESAAAEVPMVIPPLPTPAAAPTPPTPRYMIGVADGAEYLVYKVQGCTMAGGLVGLTRAYYIGDAMALGFGAFGLGAGVCSTAFFLGTYGMRYVRQKDDVGNFVLSGAFNGAWLVTGFAGPRRGAVGAIVGAATGTLIKVLGDASYDMARTAWIRNRKFTHTHQKARVLEVHKPQFRPEDSTLEDRRLRIQGKGSSGQESAENMTSVVPSSKGTGWFN